MWGGPRSGRAFLENVEWESCLVQPHRDAALERDVRQEFGVVPPALAYLSSVPWVARSLAALQLVPSPHLHEDVCDLVRLVVAEDNSCRYCYAAQRTIMRLHGFSTRRIRELEESRFAARLDPREALALEFARHVSRIDARLADDRARLAAVGWSEEAIAELACVAAANVFANRVATLPALPIASVERAARLPGLGLVAPLARRLLFGARGETAPLERGRCAGPWSFLVEALARVPAGRVLRRVLDDACDSPVLPRRSKLLVFAVVARTVRCGRSEREAIRLLMDEGVEPETIGEALRHLHSSHLDRADAAIVGFARETVRYRPAEIQRSARRLEPLLGQEAILELIGVAALANAVSRLAIVVGEPA
jgi:alkylhydroperoxidase family enzyme